MGRPDYISRNCAMPRCATRRRGLLCFRTTACFVLESAKRHYRRGSRDNDHLQIFRKGTWPRSRGPYFLRALKDCSNTVRGTGTSHVTSSSDVINDVANSSIL